MFIYKYLDSRNRSMKILHKFVISMDFAFLTMCFAGGIEVLRRDYCPRSIILYHFIILLKIFFLLI